MPGQQKTLVNLINKQSGLVQLAAIAAYFEALDSCKYNLTHLLGKPLKC